MVVNERPFKRIKTQIYGELRDIRTFDDGNLCGNFRSNFREFLARYARAPSPSSVLSPAASHLLTWRVPFRAGDGEVELEVVEEDVARAKNVYCDHCRVVGWSGHPVCVKRFHFIIRNDDNPMASCNRNCPNCGVLIHLSAFRCASCHVEVTPEALDNQAHGHLEDATNLLHGVVHANGHGHLLRVNGREGGSIYLSGCDIMGFWDRICKMLGVRKVTVMDLSKKYGMEYRLLHAVTTGRPWYGNWGYEFGTGSYALTDQAYKKAVETVSNVPLSLFLSCGRSPPTKLQNTIAFYKSLSHQQLTTVRDLFQLIMHLLHEVHENLSSTQAFEMKVKKEATSDVLCAWTREEVMLVEDTLLKVLRTADRSKWVTWRALRGVTYRAVKTPELLEYCLRGLDGKEIGDGSAVSVRCNSETNTLEFRLETVLEKNQARASTPRPSEDHLLRDLKFLYDALLNPVSMEAYRPHMTQKAALKAATMLLDCKQFIKHYDKSIYTFLPSNPFTLSIWCLVFLVDEPKDYIAPPAELLVLPITATFADLKLEATKALQETYLFFQRFQAERLLDFEAIDDSTHIKLLIGTNGFVKVKGRCINDNKLGHKLGQFRTEKGSENWVVECTCGARDDDGERMLACDLCGVWQHTRCAGIKDDSEVPARYVCRRCAKLCKPISNRTSGRYHQGTSRSSCKDEIMLLNDANKRGRLATVG